MTLPNRIISTVGTSLLGNIQSTRAPDGLKKLVDSRQWTLVADWLRSLSPDDLLCGAEINSLHELMRASKWAQARSDLHFCLSDTEAGAEVGKIVESYYETLGHSVTLWAITDLQDQDPGRFQRSGLRNLVRSIGKIVRESGGGEFVCINATGGYKAQIALAALIGQALGVTVFYKHERFPTIIPMPPMPIALDYSLLGENADLLHALEVGDQILPGTYRIDERLEPLLEVEECDGERLAALSAIGQIFLEGYRVRYPAEKTLPRPAAESEREYPSFRDDHYPDGFESFVDKIFAETPYIITCHSEPYDKQRGIADRRFYIRKSDGRIIGEYKPDDFGARFSITTTAKTEIEKVAVVEDLTTRYRSR